MWNTSSSLDQIVHLHLLPLLLHHVAGYYFLTIAAV